MNKIIIIALIFVFGYTSILAQTDTHDPKTRAILEKVSKKAQSYSTIKVVFSFTLESEQDGTEDTQEGNFTKKKDKFKVSLIGTDIYFDGKTRWTHLIDAEECQITEPSGEDEDIWNPNFLFSFYEKGFKYRLNGEKTENGKTIYEIDLFPEQPKGKQYSRVRLNVEKSTSHIQSIKLFGKDGTHYTIVIKKFSPNVPANDSEFQFDSAKYPDIDLIDLRE